MAMSSGLTAGPNSSRHPEVNSKSLPLSVTRCGLGSTVYPRAWRADAVAAESWAGRKQKVKSADEANSEEICFRVLRVFMIAVFTFLRARRPMGKPPRGVLSRSGQRPGSGEATFSMEQALKGRNSLAKTPDVILRLEGQLSRPLRACELWRRELLPQAHGLVSDRLCLRAKMRTGITAFSREIRTAPRANITTARRSRAPKRGTAILEYSTQRRRDTENTCDAPRLRDSALWKILEGWKLDTGCANVG